MKDGDKRKYNKRPNKYNPDDLAEQLNVFIDSVDDPQLARFCLDRDKPSREHLWELAKENSKLSNAITRAKTKCELYLCSPDCKIHPKIAGIRLATNHNMVERQQIDNTVSGSIDINTLSQEELDKRIADLLAKK